MAGQCTMWRLSCAEAFQYLTDVIVLLRFGEVERRDVLLFETELLIDVGAMVAQDLHDVCVAHGRGDMQARQATLNNRAMVNCEAVLLACRTYLFRSIDICASLDQVPHDVLKTLGTRAEQGRASRRFTLG